jgi:hypothetical protein
VETSCFHLLKELIDQEKRTEIFVATLVWFFIKRFGCPIFCYYLLLLNPKVSIRGESLLGKEAGGSGVYAYKWLHEAGGSNNFRC